MRWMFSYEDAEANRLDYGIGNGKKLGVLSLTRCNSCRFGWKRGFTS